MAKRPHRSGLPSREQILEFIEGSDQPAGKREIAKAFGLSGQDKIALKQLLRDMTDEGLIDATPGRAFHKMGGVPKVTVLRIVDVDEDGTPWAVPERWEADMPEPPLGGPGRRGVGAGALGGGDPGAAPARARAARREGRCARGRRPHPGSDRAARPGLGSTPD